MPRRLAWSKNAESYALPILLAIALITISQLLNLIKVKDYLIAALLLAILLGGVFVTQFLAFKAARGNERNDLFHLVSSIAMSEGFQRQSSSLLSAGSVCAIEAAADEVWIYAFDLGWEGDNSIFTHVVRENVLRGVKYRYLLPNDPLAIDRANHMRRSMTRIPRSRSLVKFRNSPRERLITQFGLTIYNPNYQHNEDGDRETVAVFFPHYRDFSDEASQADAVFLTIKGRATQKVQEAFYRYWTEASDITYGDQI
ncbi:hypothetical protein [Actinophytocola sp.]|uniref:hypothetical protein n=1 Tax=Actinophytocola sp. TaxID=1872138 RepID=UPI00389AF42D